jgi:hypothetical protein
MTVEPVYIALGWDPVVIPCPLPGIVLAQVAQ